jgi:hypothetical protein
VVLAMISRGEEEIPHPAKYSRVRERDHVIPITSFKYFRRKEVCYRADDP